MAIRPEDLPKDAAVLAEIVLAFDSENEDLRAEIATLKGLIFGARSERSAIICAEQLAFDPLRARRIGRSHRQRRRGVLVPVTNKMRRVFEATEQCRWGASRTQCQQRPTWPLGFP